MFVFSFSYIQHCARHCGSKDELDMVSTFKDFQMYKEKGFLKYRYDIVL